MKSLKTRLLAGTMLDKIGIGAITAAGLLYGRQSDWDDVSSGIWLNVEPGRRHASLQEQAFRLHGGWLMTLLVHPGDEEDDDEEVGIPDAFDVWENPSFPSARRRRK